MARLVLRHEPSLQAPSLVIGFAGWANAAGLSVEVVSQLRSLLATDAIGTLEAPECYVITNPSLANRPITTIRGGGRGTAPADDRGACLAERRAPA